MKVKITTISKLLSAMGACKKARTKFARKRNFKKTFLNASPNYAQWFGARLFEECPVAHDPITEYYNSKRIYSLYPYNSKRIYSLYPTDLKAYKRLRIVNWDDDVNSGYIGMLLRSKKNRIEYWPEVRKRLIQIGVAKELLDK